MNKDILKNTLLWLVVIGVLVVVFSNFESKEAPKAMNYSEFVAEVNAGTIKEVNVGRESITGTTTEGTEFDVVRPMVEDGGALMRNLLDKDVEVIGEPVKRQSIITQLLIASFPVLLIIALFIFFMRNAQSGMGGKGGGPMSFGKSKAKMLGENEIKVTFKDVAGCDEAKQEVVEVVDFLRDPSKFTKLGATIPRGILMVGPPGTGKTLLAKAIAGEAKVPFFSISGSDFVEMFVGVGASRVRDMFEQAKRSAPCIIFIDEIDAVGRHRGSGTGGGNDEREQTLNQMLVEMDGFGGNEGIIVIAATNRPDVLDPALLRPGRFDRQVEVGLPDIRGREQIIKVHMRKVPLGDNVDAAVIARGTPGFSGADLANLVNEAALYAARGNKRVVNMAEFDAAKDKIMMGAERKTMVMSEQEKEMTAYHEAGHAIVGRMVPEHDPVYKVSIIPRGRALGVTMYLPEQDRVSHSKELLESMISSLYGGRIAEALIYGADKVTTGASNDIERATDIARKMVTHWGLSEKLGPLLYAEDQNEMYMGGGGSRASNMSDDTAKVIDAEVRLFSDRNYERAEKILKENIDILHSMKDALMKYETIDAKQIDDLMARQPVREPRDAHDRHEPKAPQTDSVKESVSDENQSTTESSKKDETNVDDKAE